jgi:hypothetical protein
MIVRVELVGNDEGDERCDVCGRGDWWQALRFTRLYEGDAATRTTLCLHRYEGSSCADLAREALFQLKIPGGTFGAREVE